MCRLPSRDPVGPVAFQTRLDPSPGSLSNHKVVTGAFHVQFGHHRFLGAPGGIFHRCGGGGRGLSGPILGTPTGTRRIEFPQGDFLTGGAGRGTGQKIVLVGDYIVENRTVRIGLHKIPDTKRGAKPPGTRGAVPRTGDAWQGSCAGRGTACHKTHRQHEGTVDAL